MYKSWCAVICAIALAACATAPIEVSGDAAVLAPFSTFQIHEEQYVFAEELSDARRAELGSEIRQAAIQALEERGYRQASPADVLVVLGVVSRAMPLVEEEMREQGIRAVDPRVLEPGRSDMPTAAAPDRGLIAGREGDLILYLLDAKTERVLWRANASGSANTPAAALNKARATYRAMAQKLPRAAAGR